MSNILEDIVQDIEVKPNRFKAIIKWIGTIALFLIPLTFGVGKLVSSHANKVTTIETNIKNNSTKIDTLNKKFDVLDDKVDNNRNKVMEELLDVIKHQK